jgi:hypothetical protein
VLLPERDGDKEGTPFEPTLVTLAKVAVESLLEEVTLVMDNLDTRRRREVDRNNKVSTSEMGDGPGTGGNGEDGGRLRGGLVLIAYGGDADNGGGELVDVTPEGGIYDGGIGNDSNRFGDGGNASWVAPTRTAAIIYKQRRGRDG